MTPALKFAACFVAGLALTWLAGLALGTWLGVAG
jgi:hypothetical protein